MLLLGERYVRAHILLSAIRFDFQTIAKRLICAFNADHHGMSAISGGQLGQNASHMSLNGFFRHRELCGYFFLFPLPAAT
jgi:hypothetical protein